MHLAIKLFTAKCHEWAILWKGKQFTACCQQVLTAVASDLCMQLKVAWCCCWKYLSSFVKICFCFVVPQGTNHKVLNSYVHRKHWLAVCWFGLAFLSFLVNEDSVLLGNVWKDGCSIPAMIVKSRTVFYFAQLVLQKERLVRCNSFLVFLNNGLGPAFHFHWLALLANTFLVASAFACAAVYIRACLQVTIGQWGHRSSLTQLIIHVWFVLYQTLCHVLCTASKRQ